MKYVSSIILLLSATAVQAQIVEQKFDATNLKAIKMIKAPKASKVAEQARFSKISPAPLAKDAVYPAGLDGAKIEKSLTNALSASDLSIFIGDVIKDVEVFDLKPRYEPRVCPAQMGGAAFNDTYARDHFGINYLYPSSASGASASLCVTQPDGVTVTCPIPGAPAIDYQVCDYRESVSPHECDLLNTLAGYSASHPLRYMKNGSYCQKFTNLNFNVLQSIPMRSLATLDKLAKIKSGADFSCALRKVGSAAGELYCWGSNQLGQLGLGTISAGSTHAIKVRLPGDVVDFSVSYANVCAVLAPDASNLAGSIYCWGRNDKGQIGLPMSVTASGVPQKINLIYSGALDYGTSNDYMTVSSVTALSSVSEVVKQISIGSRFDASSAAETALTSLSGFTGCFVTSANNVYCWGLNAYGQTGVGRTHPDSQVQGVRIRQAFFKSGTISALATYIPASAVPTRTPSASGTGTRWAADEVHVAGNVICILGSSIDSNLKGKVLCAGGDSQSNGILGSRYMRNPSFTSGSTYSVTYLPLFVDVKTVSGATTTYSELKDVVSISANENLICAQIKIGGSSSLTDWRLPCWGRVPGTSSSGVGSLTVITAENLKFGAAFGSMAGSDVDGVLSASVSDSLVSFTRFAGISATTGLIQKDSLFIGKNKHQMMGPNSMYSGTFIGEPALMHAQYSTASSSYINHPLSNNVVNIASGSHWTGHECHIQQTGALITDNKAFCAGQNYSGQLANGDLDLGTLISGSLIFSDFPYPSTPVLY